MLQSFSQSGGDWFSPEPLLFDDDFCQSLMKDLQALPAPLAPPQKAGVSEGHVTGVGGARPLTRADQLTFVSDVLLEDWNADCFFFDDGAVAKEGGACEDSALWQAAALLGSSPLLSDIDTSIFQEIAGSTLDCQDLLESPDSEERTSDYGSAGGELSTSASSSASSSSDSEEEIDVVTVVRCPSSPAPLPLLTDRQKKEEELRALRRHHQEIQQQHNYAAPRPLSPPLFPAKRLRVGGDSSRSHAPSSSSSSSFHQHSCRSVAALETEDEEERRRTHNVMERQRRNELKNCFVRLRENVPELTANAKASKVQILKKARDAIATLEGRSQRLAAKKEGLRRQQEHLKARLQKLQDART